jgi:hypothetical protein
MKKQFLITGTVILCILAININAHAQGGDNPNLDVIADSINSIHLLGAAPHVQEVKPEKLNQIPHNYIGVLHGIKNSMLYVDLKVSENLKSKGIRVLNKATNIKLAEILFSVSEPSPCQKALFKVPKNVELMIEVLKPDDNWHLIKEVSTDYEKEDVLDYTSSFYSNIGSYFMKPEGVTTLNFNHNYRKNNQNDFFESLIFQQNLYNAFYPKENIQDIVNLANSSNNSNLGTLFPNILLCDNEIFNNLLGIDKFFDKYWTTNSFIRLNCDSSRMLDSINQMYLIYYDNFLKCRKDKIRTKGGSTGPNGKLADCNCQRLASHTFEHGYGELIEPNIFIHRFNLNHISKNASSWNSWDIDRKDDPYDGNGEKYGLGGTLSGLRNYLVLRSSGNCSKSTARLFTNGNSQNNAPGISQQYERIGLAYYCENTQYDLPDKCECEIPVSIRYKADAKIVVDQQQRSCQDWLLEGSYFSRAEVQNTMAFTVINHYKGKIEHIDHAYVSDVANGNGGFSFNLGGLPMGVLNIATGIAALQTKFPGTLPMALSQISIGLNQVVTSPPTISGGNQVFGNNPHKAMFDKTVFVNLIQNEPLEIRLDNHFKMAVAGEDGFYNWAGLQSEYSLSYLWNSQKVFNIPGDPASLCCNDGIGGFIKSTEGNIPDIYTTAARNHLVSNNFTTPIIVNSQDGKGWMRHKMNCTNWYNGFPDGGHNVFLKSAKNITNEEIREYLKFENSKLFWNIDNSLKGYAVSVYNNSGQNVFDSYSIPENNKLIYDFESSIKGIYYVIVQNSNDIKTYKYAH